MEPERTTISMGPVIEQWVRENTRTGAVSRTDVIRGLAGQVSIPTLDRWFRAAVDQGDLRRTYRSRSVYYQWTGRD